MSSAELAEVLETAAENVRAGWTQHQLFDEVDGAQYCCASGAIWLACGMERKADHPTGMLSREDYRKGHQRWWNAYQLITHHVGDDLAAWNDSIGQTQERVVDTMLHLAKELRNEAP